MAFRPDGTLYVADAGRGRVIERATDGTLSTVAGNGGQSFGGSWTTCTIASNCPLYTPTDVAVGPDGSVYVADSQEAAVGRIWPSGAFTTFAGAPGQSGACSGDGVAAATATFMSPYGVDVGPDGVVYIADEYCANVRSVDAFGTVRTFAGPAPGQPITPPPGQGIGDGGNPLLAFFTQPQNLAVGPDSTVYIGDGTAGSPVRVVRSGLPSFGTQFVAGSQACGSSGQILVPDKRGQEAYYFDARGQHQCTVDALLGVPQFTFGYQGDALSAITDVNGLSTTFDRSQPGTITITAPYGQVTTLALDTNGYLKTVTNGVAGGQYQLVHDANGLLTSFQTPDGSAHMSRMTYTSGMGAGLLSTDTDGTGATIALKSAARDRRYARRVA